MLTFFDVVSCIGGATYFAHAFQYLLAEMTLNRPSGLVLRALFPELTRGAHLLGGAVISALPVYRRNFRDVVTEMD